MSEQKMKETTVGCFLPERDARSNTGLQTPRSYYLQKFVTTFTDTSADDFRTGVLQTVPPPLKTIYISFIVSLTCQ